MATIQIRDIPEDSYETIRRRAEAAGQSLQNYMRDAIIALAARRTRDEVLEVVEAGLAEQPPGSVTAAHIAELVRADRR